MTTRKSPSKRRGRPAGSTGTRTREKIINATREVYSQKGIHGTTVELILEAANISRPTFYKYFSSAREAVEAVVEGCNREVEELFSGVFRIPMDSVTSYLPLLLVSYLNWGRSQGKLMETRFRELHDLSSPVGILRTAHNERVIGIVSNFLIADGRPRPSLVSLRAVVNCIEYMAHLFCTTATQEEMPEYVQAMSRVCIALLGNEADWRLLMVEPTPSDATEVKT